MAKNDKVLIDGIIDERVELKLPSDKRDEAFEYFAFEQILKDYDFSSDEILEGSVDGQNDGGIDGFFICVNGHLISDLETFHWPKAGCFLEVWIITCKHHDTFKQAPLDNLAASLNELFDFSLESKDLKGDYSVRILQMRENLKLAYRKVSPRLSQFSINFYYASRGNISDLGESIASRADQITQITKNAFGNCDSKFIFLGSTELIELHRKTPNFSIDLPFIEHLSSGETYIILVRLKDFYNFIQDEGKLRRYLFDSNVRAFMGLNRVNEDIRDTLLDVSSPDFWWLNNGVTILATGASSIGKVIQIRDIQIVNGLQTSESIFRYFENGGADSKNRSVLVKVIVSKDEKVRDSIIRATNNQTVVELASLHATDKIQRDIEDVLKQNDFYYERRTNFYKNQGVTSDRIIAPLYLASGFVALILKQPDQATKLKSKFMRVESSYNKVFSQFTDLNVWPKIAYLLKATDYFLEQVRPSAKISTENFLKNRRQPLMFLTVSKLLGKFDFSIAELINFDLASYSEQELQIVWDKIKGGAVQYNNSKIKRSSLVRTCIRLAKEWDLKGIERVASKSELLSKAPVIVNVGSDEHSSPKIITEIALKINNLLPPQPWKQNVHKEIMAKLKVDRREYYDSIQMLIDEKLRYYQKDGIVYDENGNELSLGEAGITPDKKEAN